jgi:hypothetical protein
MTDIAYHLPAWAITFTIGAPIFGIVAWKHWKQAQASFHWRLILSVLLACLLPPYILREDFGGVVTVDIVPAVEVALISIAAIFMSGLGAMEGVVVGLFHILLVSSALLFTWSVILRIQKQRAHDAA